jgi:hypothetical protein
LYIIIEDIEQKTKKDIIKKKGTIRIDIEPKEISICEK